jgi:esterase/lipase superfamily enzyme
MRVVRYGDAGAALVYVPTSGGDEEEFGRYGLDRELAPWIDTGRVQAFSVDGFGPKGLFDDALGPRERLAAYHRF